MTAVLLLGLLVLLGAGALCGGPPDSTERFRRDLRRAEQQLDQAHREARKEMNRVSGQSWRNTFE